MAESILRHTDTSVRYHLLVPALIAFSAWLLRQLFSQILYRFRLAKFPLVHPQCEREEEASSTLLHDGLRKSKRGPFRILSGSLEWIIVPPKYIEEVKNRDELDFHGSVAKMFFSNYPGFEAFATTKQQRVFEYAVRNHLAQALALTIAPMAEETPHSIRLVFGDAPDWKEVVFMDSIVECIARVNNLVFLGKDFMENDEWIRIAVSYSTDAFVAAKKLATVPALLRPIMHWFLPECQKIRHQVRRCRELIAPEVERRLRDIENNGGKPRKRVLDSVDWFSAACKGQSLDYPCAELELNMASIHTTANTLCFVFSDLLDHPEYLKPLREELVNVYNDVGEWNKATLANLRLMDSFIKESQRYHPMQEFNMTRVCLKDVTLSDGHVLPEGALVGFGPVLQSDPSVWPNADKFDGYRFLKLRQQPGDENRWQLASTAPEINSFGHGMHACPGRFFAANEMKLLMAQLIMHYDWKLPEGTAKVRHLHKGLGHSPNPMQKVMLRNRTPEIDFVGRSAI